mgnify:CR=1 FL=1
MKTLKAFLCEADIDWIGSGWEPSHTYQLIRNHYHDKITPENINAQLSNLVDNYKWNTYKTEWVKKSSILKGESEIDAYIDDQFKSGNYSKYVDRDTVRMKLLNDIKNTIQKIVESKENIGRKLNELNELDLSKNVLLALTEIMMMNMCMHTCCMCTISCVKISDIFSVLEVSLCAA